MTSAKVLGGLFVQGTCLLLLLAGAQACDCSG